MPTYGKGRAKRYTPERLSRIGFNRIISRNKKRIQFGKQIGDWKQFRSPLTRVSEGLGIELPEWVRQHASAKKRPLAVLDWACGDGLAIRQLQQRFPEEVHAYGYDHHSHKDWLKDEHVKYIHEDAAKMLRYIKPHSLDVAYSFYGLTHYLHSISLPARIRYIRELVRKLRPGGMFVMNFDSSHLEQADILASALRRTLPRATVDYAIHGRLKRFFVLRIVLNEAAP